MDYLNLLSFSGLLVGFLMKKYLFGPTPGILDYPCHTLIATGMAIYRRSLNFKHRAMPSTDDTGLHVFLCNLLSKSHYLPSHFPGLF